MPIAASDDAEEDTRARSSSNSSCSTAHSAAGDTPGDAPRACPRLASQHEEHAAVLPQRDAQGFECARGSTPPSLLIGDVVPGHDGMPLSVGQATPRTALAVQSAKRAALAAGGVVPGAAEETEVRPGHALCMLCQARDPVAGHTSVPCDHMLWDRGRTLSPKPARAGHEAGVPLPGPRGAWARAGAPGRWRPRMRSHRPRRVANVRCTAGNGCTAGYMYRRIWPSSRKRALYRRRWRASQCWSGCTRPRSRSPSHSSTSWATWRRSGLDLTRSGRHVWRAKRRFAHLTGCAYC